MNTIEKNILEIAENAIGKSNCVLIEPVFRGERGSKVVQFFIDSEKDVTADLCAEISREIGDRLEEMPDAPSFRLEVSSPGIDRPLKFLLQYPKHTGRKFEIEYTEDGEIKELTGKLQNIEEPDTLVFLVKKEEIKINFNKINKAKVLISFS